MMMILEIILILATLVNINCLFQHFPSENCYPLKKSINQSINKKINLNQESKSIKINQSRKLVDWQLKKDPM